MYVVSFNFFVDCLELNKLWTLNICKYWLFKNVVELFLEQAENKRSEKVNMFILRDLLVDWLFSKIEITMWRSGGGS